MLLLFMNFAEAATTGVLWKELFLKMFAIFKIYTTLLKKDSNTDALLWLLWNVQEHPFWRTSADACFWFFKTATEQWWAATSILTLLLSSDNLLTESLTL